MNTLMYKAFYIIDGKKVYIRGGKLYKTLKACKNGIYNDIKYGWHNEKNIDFIIEKWEIKWSEDVLCAHYKYNEERCVYEAEYENIR